MGIYGYYTPTRVVFGRGAEEKVGELLKSHGFKKVLIHYGGGSVVRSGLLGRVKAALDSSGVAWAELGGVVPNPRLGLVYKGIELAKAEGAELVLAVGGGSVIDSAKAIGLGMVNDGDVWDFYDNKRMPTASLPVAAVLTNAATGSEMSSSSVITREEGLVKRGLNTDLSRPLLAFMNPELTLTLPDYQTDCGCADIWMHTMERYFGRGERLELVDALAEALMKTVMTQARILVAEPRNYQARAEVMWASSLSHNGLTGFCTDGGDWSTHRLEHELGGLFDVAHGAGLTALWGSWARYVWRGMPERFESFALHVMEVAPGGTQEETVLRGIAAAEDFFRSIRMPLSITQLGPTVTPAQIEEMAHKCAVAHPKGLGKVITLSEADMIAIYTAAL